jgi:hypothetical protein
VKWEKSHRIIRTIYPPVDLFEDIAPPEDWEMLVAAEARFNPRIRDSVGNLALVPVHRRVAGPTASFVMAAFTHVSKARPSRFSDGSYGVWYCGDRRWRKRFIILSASCGQLRSRRRIRISASYAPR